ncbi:hypothetical protein B296_00046143 [Ensete ventricosum]|uniref:Uncharacterized protein n=1 Tax=Ensete ventricosum TaxID=4639 RepID=A0A426XM12_ENSVE|nr:hypothetical protein B296_00046143 [Ensete ventricosum]
MSSFFVSGPVPVQSYLLAINCLSCVRELKPHGSGASSREHVGSRYRSNHMYQLVRAFRLYAQPTAKVRCRTFGHWDVKIDCSAAVTTNLTTGGEWGDYVAGASQPTVKGKQVPLVVRRKQVGASSITIKSTI